MLFLWKHLMLWSINCSIATWARVLNPPASFWNYEMRISHYHRRLGRIGLGFIPVSQGQGYCQTTVSMAHKKSGKTGKMSQTSGQAGIRSHQFSSVQSLGCDQLFATPWTTAHQASLSITNSRSPPKPIFIVSVMPSNHLSLCCPLLLLSSIFPSIRVFSNESAVRIRWPKHWSFSFKISPTNEHPGLISFRMDWLDLQGTLKNLLQHHRSKASILWRSAL